MSRIRKCLPLVILAVCAMLPLWRAIFLGETIGLFDNIRQMAPWNGPPSSRPWDVLQADSVLQFYPWRDMVFEAWGKGQIPAWNPYELAGTPLLANSQSAAFYPLHILAGVLHIGTGAAMTFLAWFHLFWAGLGTYFLARKLGASRPGGLFAGLAFELSPFMLAWTALPSVITTVAWIPWILGLGVTVFPKLHEEGDAPLRQSFFSAAGPCAALAVCVGMMFLGGHLQFSAYGCLALGILTIWLCVSLKTLRGVGTVLLGLVLGGCIAAPQLLPVLAYSKFSHRANVASVQGYAAYVGGAIPIYALQAVAFPTALGSPAKFMPVKFSPEGDLAPNNYWPGLTHLGSDFAETSLGLGPLVFVLLCFTRKTTRGAAGLAAVGVLALLLALGTPVNMLLYFGIPGWSATGSPGRALVLFVLAAVVLAGLNLERVLQNSQRTKFIIAGSALLVGLILAVAPVSFGLQYTTPYNPEAVSNAIKQSVLAELPMILASAVVALVALLVAGTSRLWVFAVGVVICALPSYALDLVPTSKATIPSISANAQDRYAYVNSLWGLPLVPFLLPSRALVPPNTALYSRIHDIVGYDSLLHRDSVELLRSIDGEDPAPPTNGNMMLIKPKMNIKRLGDAGVTQLLSLRPLENLPATAPDPSGIYRYGVPGRGRAYTPSEAAQITRETFSTLTISASGPGPLVVKDRNMPGWTALVDGAPATIKEGLWREVDLSSGHHNVLFRYSPPGMKNGCILGMFGLAGVLSLLALRGRSKQSVLG